MSEIRFAATIATVALLAGSLARADVTREVIFVTGQPAVGFPQGATIHTLIGGFVRPQVNTRGHVLLTGLAGSNASNDQGLWLATRDGLVLLLREGDPAPGIADATVAQWYVYGLTEDDAAILHILLAGSGVSVTNDTAIGRVAPGTGLQFIAREGDPVSDDPADGTWLDFVVQTTFDSRANIHGEVLIGASRSGALPGFWFTRGLEMVPLAQIGQQAPDAAPGTTVQQLIKFGWSDDRIGLFRVYLSGGDANETNAVGLAAFGEHGDVMVARQSSTPPGAPDGTYSQFPYGNAAGADNLVFHAFLSAPGTNDSGFWTGTPEDVRLLVRQGDQAPGLPPGRLLTNIYWPAVGPDAAGFVANASGGGSGAFAERDGELRLLCYSDMQAADLPAGVLYGQIVSFGNDSPLRFGTFGRATFANMLVGSGVPDNGRFAVFQTDVAGTTHLVLRATEILATPLGARTFITASNISLTPNGLMAIHATLSNPSAIGIVLAHVGCPGEECDGLDLDGDCTIGLQDLATLLGGFGREGLDVPGDYDGSGQVDLQDLATLLAVFGQDCSGS